MKTLQRLAYTFALATSLAAPATNAALILDLTTGGSNSVCGTCGSTNGQTLGWAFDVSQTIQVNGIGVWDFGSDGFQVPMNIQAGLWEDGGALRASVTVTGSSELVDSAHSTGDWRFEDIPTLTLTAGRYVVGNVFLGAFPFPSFNFQPTTMTIPGVSYIEAWAFNSSDSGFQRPDSSSGLDAFGTTLRTAAVPAPSSTALLALGALALSAYRRARG